MDEEWARSEGIGQDSISAVRLIGLISREYHTPIPQVLKLHWGLFLALLSDYNARQQAQEDEMRSINRRSNVRSIGGR